MSSHLTFRVNRASRLSSLSLVAFLVLSILALLPARPALAAPALPAGFAQEVVSGGYNLPTAIAWRPDGGMYVAEKSGKVYLFKDGAKKLVYDLEAEVNDYWDRGMLGLEVDRDDGALYLLYTKENNAPHEADKTGALVRVAMNGDTATSTTALLGTAATSSTRTCKDLPESADCIPSDSPSHTIGEVKQASDGTLFVTTGDGARFDITDPAALRSQHIDSLAGKVLRIDKSGRGVASNPFYNGDPKANRSKVYAYGFRNAFRYNLQPGTNAPVLGDVQWGGPEEVNYVKAGANYGWPCYEGPGQQSSYANDPATKPECDALYAKGSGAVTAPIVSYPHNGSSAVVGGDFYAGTSYPGVPQGAYFYSDYHQAFLKYLTLDSAGNVTSGPIDFASGLEGPVDLETGPDGNLYYVSIISGNIYRIVYRDAAVTCQAGQFTASYYSNVGLTGTPSARACHDAVNFDWAYGSPDPAVPADNFSASFQATRTFPAGTHEFTVTGDDGVRLYIDDQLLIDKWVDQPPTTYKASRSLTAGEHKIRLEYYERGGGAVARLSWAASTQNPPVATISSPADKAEVVIGSTVNFSGSATDAEDGTIPAATLAWDVVIEHCAPTNASDCHPHPLVQHTGGSGSFIYPDHGADPYFVKLTLKATDSSGLTSTKTHNIYPQRSVAACPSGQYTMTVYKTMDLSGTPAVTKCVAGIDNDWGAGSPDPSVPADGFSVRWTGDRTFDAATYRFTMTGDDGVRLFLDEKLVPGMDQWRDQSATQYAADVPMSTGTHKVRFEYYENGGDAVARLGYATASVPPPSDCPSGQYRAEFFAGRTLSGAPLVAACTDEINYSMGAGSPDPAVPADDFSGRWTAVRTFEAGTYVFETTSDDGVRVFVDGKVVPGLDQWKLQAPTTYRAEVPMTAGSHEIRVEYYEATGGAVMIFGYGLASDTVKPPASWSGEYWSTPEAGSKPPKPATPPTLARKDAVIGFDWGYGSPDGSIPADHFIAKWTGVWDLAPGTYRITTTADDGIQAYVAGSLVHDYWLDQPPTTQSSTFTVSTAGPVEIVVWYYENAGGAVAKFGLTGA